MRAGEDEVRRMDEREGGRERKEEKGAEELLSDKGR